MDCGEVMKTFEVWYSEGEFGKAWFTAKDLKHAEELLAQVDRYNIKPQDLPNFEFNVKGGDGWTWELLEEI
jgi:hypothetical protein